MTTTDQPTITLPSEATVRTDVPARKFKIERSGTSSLLMFSMRVALLLSAVGVWEIVGHATPWGKWISSPTGVWDQLLTWHRVGVLWSSIQATLTASLLGFVLGSLLGSLGGFILGSMRRIGALLEPFVAALYAIPKIALAPLFVLWFGIDLLPKVMMAAMLVGFLVFFSVFQGTRTIDQQLLSICRLMGCGRVAILRKVTVPYCSAWVFTGLKLGLPYALIGAVVGEFMAATKGVGFLIKNASDQFNTDGVFAGVVILVVISMTLSAALAWVEKRMLHWADKGI